jgi:hypothetical protein
VRKLNPGPSSATKRLSVAGGAVPGGRGESELPMVTSVASASAPVASPEKTRPAAARAVVLVRHGSGCPIRKLAPRLSASGGAEAEDLHTICTRAAWLLHKRELRFFVTGLRSARGICGMVRLRHTGVFFLAGNFA